MIRRKSGLAIIDDHKGAVTGSDEAGYGPWAGPLVVCAVTAPPGWDDPRVKDSKQLSAKVREQLFEEFWADGRFIISPILVSAQEIDQLGVYNAVLKGHTDAIRGTYHTSHRPPVVIDGKYPLDRIRIDDGHFAKVCLPKADALVPECALASIVAKVLHDRKMMEIHALYPGYGFDKHMGYGTVTHQEALSRLGACPEHRRSFAPVSRSLSMLDTPPPLEKLIADGFI